MERINYDSVQEVRMCYTQMGLIEVIGVQKKSIIQKSINDLREKISESQFLRLH